MRGAALAALLAPLVRDRAIAQTDPLPSWNDTAPWRAILEFVQGTTAAREWAYDRKSDIGRLGEAWDEAIQRGWAVVDMKTD